MTISDNLWQGAAARLTAITKDDLPILARWHADAGFQRLLDARAARPQTEDDVNKWVDNAQRNTNDYLFAVRPLAGEDLLGFVELDGIHWNRGVAWLTIAIGDRDNWGKGIGTEAIDLTLRFAFHELNLHRVQLTVFEYNDRAIAVYERLGFQREGIFRESLYRDNRRYDMYLYGLLRREWEAQQQPE
jgi:RimJ/RimL family protein N-acetyltransferase